LNFEKLVAVYYIFVETKFSLTLEFSVETAFVYCGFIIFQVVSSVHDFIIFDFFVFLLQNFSKVLVLLVQLLELFLVSLLQLYNLRIESINGVFKVFPFLNVITNSLVFLFDDLVEEFDVLFDLVKALYLFVLQAQALFPKRLFGFELVNCFLLLG